MLFRSQGFVRTSTLKDDETPENPIRRFIISPSIFNIVKSALMDPELEEMPTDYQRGLDFKITKTKSGKDQQRGQIGHQKAQNAFWQLSGPFIFYKEKTA